MGNETGDFTDHKFIVVTLDHDNSDLNYVECQTEIEARAEMNQAEEDNQKALLIFGSILEVST